MQKTNTISCHQTGIMAGLLLLVLKLTSFPSLMFECNEVGGFVSIILICLLNIGFLALIVWLKKKFNNLSFYEILKKYLGTILTKIIYFLLIAFFIAKLLALVDEGFGFIRDVADEEFTYFKFIICFFPIIIALSYSGIRNIGRTMEFFFPFVLIGLFIAMVFSFAPINFFGIGSFDRLNLSCIGDILTTLSFWNGDLFAILVFIDRVDLKKGKIKHIFSPILIVSTFLIVGYGMYYSLYQETASLHANAIFDIVEYSIGTSNGWHLDIFAILIYMVCLFLQGSLYLFCTVKSIEKTFNFYNTYIIHASIITFMLIVQFLYLNDYLKYVIFARENLSPLSLGLLILIPILMLVSIMFKRRKNARNYKKS